MSDLILAYIDATSDPEWDMSLDRLDASWGV